MESRSTTSVVNTLAKTLQGKEQQRVNVQG